MVNALAVVASYLIGSVNFAVLVGRRSGVDIYAVGSGNPGAANVMRSLRGRSALLVLLSDAAKGALAATIGLLVGGEPLAVVTGFAAVLGHCYPAFHRFKGGKGMATAAGMLLVVFPVPAVILAAVWAVIVVIWRTASIGSLVAMAAAVPLLAVFGVGSWELLWVAATVMLVLVRHLDNIRRLLQGTEATVTGHDG